MLPIAAVVLLLQTGCVEGHGATLETFAERYYGHDRGLGITRDGRAHEVVNSGCCHLVIELRFRLSQPRGTSRDATARAIVTWVRLGEKQQSMWPKGLPVPRVGDTQTLRLRDGVLSESLTGTTYCDPSHGGDGKCGA